MRRRTGTTIAGAALAVGLVAASSSPVDAAFPGGDGLLTFSRNGIWVASGSTSDGSYEETRLTTGDHRNPRWSSDGSRIVFNTRAGKIRTVSADGSVKRTIIADRGYQPAYSPVLDGGRERIVYVDVPRGKGGDIWTVPSRGGKPVRVTTDGAGSCGNSWPTWSPDGRYVAWVHESPGCEPEAPADVFLLDRRTGVRSKVPHSLGGDVDLVPSTERLSFTSDGTALIYGAVDDACLGLRGRYDVATRDVQPQYFLSCEGETHEARDEFVPTPGGGFAIRGGGFVSWPNGAYSFSSSAAMTSLDVQPVG
jgi:Tol biopolymer transport system component